MAKIDTLALIKTSLSVYYHEENAILRIINDAMREIGTINIINEVREAYKNNSFDGILFYEGMEDNYPIVQIEYDKEDNKVWVKFYVGDAVDEESWEDNYDNYGEDEARYLSETEQVEILELIKEYLSKKEINN